MVEKLMALRWAVTCANCGAFVPATAEAWWDTASTNVTCADCRTASELVGATIVAAEPEPVPFDELDAEPVVECVAVQAATPSEFAMPTIDAANDLLPGRARAPAVQSRATASEPRVVGVPGLSVSREYRRRRDRDATRDGVRARPGPSTETEAPSTRSWAIGAAGEEHLAAELGDRLGPRCVVLHDLGSPDSEANIDHIVVAPSGVWIIDAKNYAGRVQCRSVGAPWRRQRRLYVKKRNRTHLTGGFAGQRMDVLEALEGLPRRPVHTALCFTSWNPGSFARPFEVNDVWITWPKRLAKMINARGPLSDAAIDPIVDRLIQELRCASEV